MFEQILNLAKLKLNYKVILIAAVSLVLLLLFLTQKKIFFLLAITGISIIVGLIVRFVAPLKYFGIELVTISTIMIGSLFGPFVGAVFGVSLLIIHLIVGHFHGGIYLMWILPEYAVIGILSSSLSGVRMFVALAIGINVVNTLLTFLFYRERVGRQLLYSVGNAIFNSIMILNFFNLIISMI